MRAVGIRSYSPEEAERMRRGRQAKLRARAERLSKYYQTCQLDTEVAAAACAFAM